MKKKLLIVLLTSVMALSACGRSPGARILENIASSVSDEVKSGKTKASPEEEPDESQVADEAGGAQTAQEPVPEQEPAMEHLGIEPVASIC